ncbi:hypothetical protein EVAR_70052_1 [Eumeta japonica]|uniref:Uncharacterized protein n=1 Tax=Eumeta variegata TaxID=151549 RepID=A0A4C1T917_EUMVA|nr:hypothetical protein EVAR_70052_1 [Eumeta japonica]
MLLVVLAEKNLYIEKLQAEEGYIEINIGKAKIVRRYNYINHTINFKELEELVKGSRILVEKMDKTEFERIAHEDLLEMETMLKMLRPHRLKRGLINAGGSLLKFVWGTMDDEDRKIIEEHQRVIDENNHRLIKGLNHQILINDAFNKSITSLKIAIEADGDFVTKN